jgi:hypothetical protein
LRDAGVKELPFVMEVKDYKKFIAKLNKKLKN